MADEARAWQVRYAAIRDRDFVATGSYWRGSVWLPTAYMAIKAQRA